MASSPDALQERLDQLEADVRKWQRTNRFWVWGLLTFMAQREGSCSMVLSGHSVLIDKSFYERSGKQMFAVIHSGYPRRK